MIRPAETVNSPGKVKAILKCVFNSQTYGGFSRVFLRLVYSSIPLWPENHILWCQAFGICWTLVLWPSIWTIFRNVVCVLVATASVALANCRARISFRSTLFWSDLYNIFVCFIKCWDRYMKNFPDYLAFVGFSLQFCYICSV